MTSLSAMTDITGARPVLGQAGASRRMSVNVVGGAQDQDSSFSSSSTNVKKRRSKSMTVAEIASGVLSFSGGGGKSELSPRSRSCPQMTEKKVNHGRTDWIHHFEFHVL